jgi:hypothetical protein
MDLSIFDRVFALRDEARKAQLGATAPDLPELTGGSGAGKVAEVPPLPQQELAVDLMGRAAALRTQANKVDANSSGLPRTAVAELLDAASAALPVFDESELSGGGTAPADKNAVNSFTSAVEARHEDPGRVAANKDVRERKKPRRLSTQKTDVRNRARRKK